MINRVLVICVGNICRSPMAEGLLREALPDCRLSSAGLGALAGHPADPIAVELMQARSVDITGHRARQLHGAMMAESDLVLVMELGQQRHLEQLYPLARGKIFRVCESLKADVADPYRQGKKAFEDALGLIARGVESWTARINGLGARARRSS